MRRVYLGLVIVFICLLLFFSAQNLTSVTIAFFNISATLPLALLVILVYIFGMVTGGFVWTLLRTWIMGARKETPARRN